VAAIELLSPHIDDAVFSCWHILSQPGAEVITVFAGVPSERTSTVWDRMCGESDSVVMMQKRLRENEAAIESSGASIQNLDYLDTQYRPSEYSIAAIAEDILSRTEAESSFYAPLAGSKLWRHPDHVTVRMVGKFLLDHGRKVSFYADVPYMQMPSRPNSTYTSRELRRAQSLLGFQLSIEVFELNSQEQDRKQAAMMQYQSQYNVINILSAGMLKKRANLEREIVFHQAD